MTRSLPTLTPLTQRLAANNRRAAAALDQLPTIVEQLLAAYLRQDQPTLRELSQHLATFASGQPALAHIARELAGHVASRQDLPLKRSLLALVGEVGGLRRRGIVPATAAPAKLS